MSAQITPQPTQEEAVAITAVLESAMSQNVIAAVPQSDRPNWRFSGRWWAKSTIARRQRPWT
jgi:hypothetical protein